MTKKTKNKYNHYSVYFSWIGSKSNLESVV